MKVVHINTFQTGGAALCAIRICSALRNLGVDSKMLFAFGETSDVYDVMNNNGYSWSKNHIVKFFQTILCKLHFWPKQEYYATRLCRCLEKYNRENGASSQLYFSSPLTNYKDLANHPWIKEADIVHLHWIANFVDFETFFKSVNKPIVWTLHDENPGMGGFHYSGAKNSAPSYLQSLDKVFFDIKAHSLTHCNRNLHLVAISQKMQKFCITNNSLKRFPVSVINNGIDADKFSMIEKEEARIRLGLPKDRTIFLFSSYYIEDSRKGLCLLIETLSRLKRKDIFLVCMGNYEETPKATFDILCTGLIKGAEVLSTYYSAADYFIMPSFEESFGQTPLESIACGTPVVSFPCGISPELINKDNGVLCDDFTIESLLEGISKIQTMVFNSKRMREDVMHRFSYVRIADQYNNMYKTLID